MTSRRHRTAAGACVRPQPGRPEPAVPDGLLSDRQWLAWARDYGLDLRERDQLLDAAAVGLTVLCWRNTSLEDVHAGEERARNLEQLGGDADDPAVQAEEEHARRSLYEALDADWDVLADADPDESERIRVFLLGRAEGFGIPDDIMMRLNISTAFDVRAVLEEVMPDAVTEPDAPLTYDHDSVPDHVMDLVELLQDPHRELDVGGTGITAGEVLGGMWEEYTEDVIRKISMHVGCCDMLGVRRAVWYAGLSGILYASGWFPNPWWKRAVDQLRQAVLEGRTAEVFYFPKRARSIPGPTDEFWERLLAYPAELNGPQCAWVQRTRLPELIRAVRDRDRQRLGPLDDDHRFPALGIMF